MVEFSEVLDVSLIFLLDFLDCHLFPIVLAHEDSSLGTRAQPLQLLDGLKWYLPVILLNLLRFVLANHHPDWLETSNKTCEPTHIRHQARGIESVGHLSI